MEIRLEHDVVLVRQRARQIAGLLGFESQDQTRIATAVSEIARNAFQYAGGGKVEFLVEEQAPPRLPGPHRATAGRASPTCRRSSKAVTPRRRGWAWASSASAG